MEGEGGRERRREGEREGERKVVMGIEAGYKQHSDYVVITEDS